MCLRLSTQLVQPRPDISVLTLDQYREYNPYRCPLASDVEAYELCQQNLALATRRAPTPQAQADETWWSFWVTSCAQSTFSSDALKSPTQSRTIWNASYTLY